MVNTDEKRMQYLRAKEVLDNAGWLFDEYVNGRMGGILKTDPADTAARERLVTEARVAAHLKLALLQEVQTYEDNLKVMEWKEKRDGNRNDE